MTISYTFINLYAIYNDYLCTLVPSFGQTGMSNTGGYEIPVPVYRYRYRYRGRYYRSTRYRYPTLQFNARGLYHSKLWRGLMPDGLTTITVESTRCNVLALHSLPGSAGYRLLHPRLVMYDLCGFSRPLRRPASPESFCFVVKLRCCKADDSR